MQQKQPNAVPSEAVPAAQAKTRCGVYFLVGGGEVVYIGQSSRLPQRITDHRRNGVSFEQVFVVECQPDDLTSIEYRYIGQIRPPLNRQLAPVVPADTPWMKRYNVYIGDVIIERLRQRAKRDGVTVAEIIRRAIVEFLGNQGE